MAFIGKERSVLKYFEMSDCPLSIGNVQFLSSVLTFWAMASFFPALCWTHLGVALLRRCHWGFYLLMFMLVISTLSAPGRHSTSHFEMQCNVWTQSSDAGNKCSNNSNKVLEKKGLGGLRGEGLNRCQMSFTEFYSDWWVPADSLVGLPVGCCNIKTQACPALDGKVESSLNPVKDWVITTFCLCLIRSSTGLRMCLRLSCKTVCSAEKKSGNYYYFKL